MHPEHSQPDGTTEYLTGADLDRETNERVAKYFRKPPPPPIADRASIEIYRRPEADYLLVANLVSDGPWMVRRDQPAVVLDADLSPEDLGGVLVDALAVPAWVDPDPMAARHRVGKHAVLSQAKVRSWREFVHPSLHVSVDRAERLYRVTTWARDLSRIDDVYKPASDGHARLTAPTAHDLGHAVQRAFEILANDI